MNRSRHRFTRTLRATAALSILGVIVAGCAAPDQPAAARHATSAAADAVCGAGDWDATTPLHMPAGSNWWYDTTATCRHDPRLDARQIAAFVMAALGTSAASITSPDAGGPWTIISSSDTTGWHYMQIQRTPRTATITVRTFLP